MTSMAEHLTMSVTEFKAKCLDVFTRLEDHRLAGVTVTRRGKPVAEMVAPKPTTEQGESLWGCMRGTVIIPPGVDLTEPFFEGEIEAENACFDR